jgi:polyhydroxybutyrate depolymerase
MPTDGVVSEWFEIRALGTLRRYLVIRPGGTDPATLPTVVDLHGSGSGPDEHAAITAAREFAALGAFIAVPQAGIDFRMLADWPAGWAWNVPGSPLPGEDTPRDKPDDVAFMTALTNRLVERHGVDPDRIHVRGFSGGARLASHLMAVMTDRLTSVCCVAGVRFVKPSPGRVPPLLAIHGLLDTVNPFLGNVGPRWLESVESAVSQWAVASRCGPVRQDRVVSDRVREARYVDADGFAAVRLVAVADAEHAWPGTRHSAHIEQFGAPGSWAASQAHWDFVREVELNGRRLRSDVNGPDAYEPTTAPPLA